MLLFLITISNTEMHPTKLFYEKGVLWLPASACFDGTALFTRHVYITKTLFILTRTAPFHRKFTTEAQNTIKLTYNLGHILLCP